VGDGIPDERARVPHSAAVFGCKPIATSGGYSPYAIPYALDPRHPKARSQQCDQRQFGSA
jgi:hypothetical protein